MKNVFKVGTTAVVVAVFSLFGFSAAYGYGGGGGAWVILQQQNKPKPPVVVPVAPQVILPSNASGTPSLGSKSQAQENRGKNQTVKVLGVKTYADGTLVRTSDKKIYVFKNGEMVHIKSMSELKKYKGKAVIEVKGEVLGVKLYDNGTLIRAKDGKVYVIKNGKKQHVKTLAELKKYAGQKIINVSDDTLKQY